MHSYRDNCVLVRSALHSVVIQVELEMKCISSVYKFRMMVRRPLSENRGAPTPIATVLQLFNLKVAPNFSGEIKCSQQYEI